MKPRPRLTAAAVLAALTLTLTACGDSPDDKEPTVNPEQSVEAMKKTFVDLIGAAAPAATDVLSDVVDVPCGGVGGNEWNKVKYSLQTVEGIFVDDPAAAVRAARERAVELGLEVSETLDGDGFRFTSEHLSASLTVDAENGAYMIGETPCADNPDR